MIQSIEIVLTQSVSSLKPGGSAPGGSVSRFTTTCVGTGMLLACGHGGWVVAVGPVVGEPVGRLFGWGGVGRGGWVGRGGCGRLGYRGLPARTDLK